MTVSRDLVLQVLDRAELRREHHVLELGCGTGWSTRLLARLLEHGRVYGADPDAAAIEAARSAPHPTQVAFSQVDPVALPYADGSLHRVILQAGLELDEAARATALREAWRVLVEEGRVLVATTRDPAETAAALIAAGFDQVEREELVDRRAAEGEEAQFLHLLGAVRASPG